MAKILDSTKFGGIELKFRQIGEAVAEQRSDIDTLKFLISHFLSGNELALLAKLASAESYEIDVNVFPTEFQAELRHLRGLGFIDSYEGKGIRSMYMPDATNSDKRDVRKFFFVTDSGRRFLELRGGVT